MDRFYSDMMMMALYSDALESSHPVSSKVTDSADIGSIFDAISYQKGASLINMIMEIGGEEAMRRGLTEYLLRYQYANARGEDLWRVLNKVRATVNSRL